jgi:hypothetical protein
MQTRLTAWAEEAPMGSINGADTAWVLVSTALVMLMTYATTVPHLSGT